MAAPAVSVVLAPEAAARLQAALQEAARSAELAALRQAMADPAASSLLLVMALGEVPGATIVRTPSAQDPLAAWLGLSCI